MTTRHEHMTMAAAAAALIFCCKMSVSNPAPQARSVHVGDSEGNLLESEAALYL